jgi:hypothetical protein
MDHAAWLDDFASFLQRHPDARWGGAPDEVQLQAAESELGCRLGESHRRLLLRFGCVCLHGLCITSVSEHPHGNGGDVRFWPRIFRERSPAMDFPSGLVVLCENIPEGDEFIVQDQRGGVVEGPIGKFFAHRDRRLRIEPFAEDFPEFLEWAKAQVWEWN